MLQSTENNISNGLSDNLNFGQNDSRLILSGFENIQKQLKAAAKDNNLNNNNISEFEQKCSSEIKPMRKHPRKIKSDAKQNEKHEAKTNSRKRKNQNKFIPRSKRGSDVKNRNEKLSNANFLESMGYSKKK